MIEYFQPLPGEIEFTLDVLPLATDWSTGALVASHSSGPQTLTAGREITQARGDGSIVQAFGGDFFNRVHYSFLLTALGNVISQQVLTLTVWNAYSLPQTLNSITAANAEGITITGGPALPYPVEALRELTYTLTVETNGAPTIDAAWTFDWDTEPNGVVRVTGSRITAWTFIPDWSAGVLERMEWLTDVLQAYDGSEQRRALRLSPRKAFEFEAFFTAQERRYAESLLWGWGARVWALPVWPDGTDLASAVNIGDTQIMVSTATRAYEAGGLAILLRDALTYEVTQIDTVQSDRLILKRGLTQAWPMGTRLWPAFPSRLRDKASLQRWNDDASGMRVAFELDADVDYTADGGSTTYRGYPVLTARPNWAGGLDLDLERKLSELDNMVGVRVSEDEAGMPLPTQRMRWTWATRAETDAFRKLAYALRGRHYAAWVPTWEDDLLPVAPIDLAATSIDIQFMAYTQQIAAGVGRRDIRIELTDGTVFHRRISGAQQVSASIERVVIDSPLGRTVATTDVVRVSFMTLMRLDSDAVELQHWSGEVSDAAVALKGFRSGV